MKIINFKKGVINKMQTSVTFVKKNFEINM